MPPPTLNSEEPPYPDQNSLRQPLAYEFDNYLRDPSTTAPEAFNQLTAITQRRRRPASPQDGLFTRQHRPLPSYTLTTTIQTQRTSIT